MKASSSILIIVLVLIALLLGWFIVAEKGPWRGALVNSSQTTGASNAAVADWLIDSDPVNKVSLSYPPDWFRLTPLQTPEGTFRYYATKNVGAPLELSQNDAWVTLAIRESGGLTLERLASQFGRLEEQPSFNQPVIRNRRGTSVDGVPGIRQIEDSTVVEGTESAYVDSVYLIRDGKLFVLSLLVSNPEVYSFHRPTFDLMINTMRFS